MAEIQTKPTDADVDAYLAGLDEPRRSQAVEVRDLMARVTGAPAVMWGPAIIGFGSQPYQGRSSSGEWMVVGVSGRKAALTLYGVYSEYGPPDPLMDDLGPHSTGKGCLYLKRLEGVDLGVLERLVRQAWDRAGVA